MRGEGVIFRREMRAALRSIATYVVWAAFLTCSGWSLAGALRAGEGGFATAVAIWAGTIGWWLPFLCAFATMRLFAAERSSGTIETLLTAPVQEWQVVCGKYMAAYGVSLAGLALTLVVPMAMLPRLAPALSGAIPGAPVALAAAVLALQAALWCAIGLYFSLLWSNAVAALASALLCCAVLPNAAAMAVSAWRSGTDLARLGVPGGAWAAEASGGMVAVAPWVCHGVAVWCFLFLTVQLLEKRQIRSV